jgi:hypothetical protein
MAVPRDGLSEEVGRPFEAQVEQDAVVEILRAQKRALRMTTLFL